MTAVMDRMKSKEEENKAKQAIDRATGGKLAGAPKLSDQSTWLANGVKKKQEAADFELTHALMCAGVAPFFLDCVPPAPECVAATAEEKERREGRRVRRPARYDD